MMRKTMVLGIALFSLAAIGWAGWANWKLRQQADEARLENAQNGTLIPVAFTDENGQPQESGMSIPPLGKPAPALALEDLNGKKISLADYKGKAVLINFWATWCGPCKIETPWIVELRDKYASQGFEVLGVSMDDMDTDNAAKLADEKKQIARGVELLHIDYPVLINGASLGEAYGELDGLPTSFFVDRNGNLVAAQLGLGTKDELEAKIRKALGN